MDDADAIVEAQRENTEIKGVREPTYDRKTNRHSLTCFVCEQRLIKQPNLNLYYCSYCQERYVMFYTTEANLKSEIIKKLKGVKE